MYSQQIAVEGEPLMYGILPKHSKKYRDVCPLSKPIKIEEQENTVSVMTIDLDLDDEDDICMTYISPEVKSRNDKSRKRHKNFKDTKKIFDVQHNTVNPDVELYRKLSENNIITIGANRSVNSNSRDLISSSVHHSYSKDNSVRNNFTRVPSGNKNTPLADIIVLDEDDDDDVICIEDNKNESIVLHQIEALDINVEPQHVPQDQDINCAQNVTDESVIAQNVTDESVGAQNVTVEFVSARSMQKFECSFKSNGSTDNQVYEISSSEMCDTGNCDASFQVSDQIPSSGVEISSTTGKSYDCNNEREESYSHCDCLDSQGGSCFHINKINNNCTCVHVEGAENNTLEHGASNSNNLLNSANSINEEHNLQQNDCVETLEVTNKNVSEEQKLPSKIVSNQNSPTHIAENVINTEVCNMKLDYIQVPKKPIKYEIENQNFVKIHDSVNKNEIDVVYQEVQGSPVIETIPVRDEHVETDFTQSQNLSDTNSNKINEKEADTCNVNNCELDQSEFVENITKLSPIENDISTKQMKLILPQEFEHNQQGIYPSKEQDLDVSYKTYIQKSSETVELNMTCHSDDEFVLQSSANGVEVFNCQAVTLITTVDEEKLKRMTMSEETSQDNILHVDDEVSSDMTSSTLHIENNVNECSDQTSKCVNEPMEIDINEQVESIKIESHISPVKENEELQTFNENGGESLQSNDDFQKKGLDDSNKKSVAHNDDSPKRGKCFNVAVEVTGKHDEDYEKIVSCIENLNKVIENSNGSQQVTSDQHESSHLHTIVNEMHVDEIKCQENDSTDTISNDKCIDEHNEVFENISCQNDIDSVMNCKVGNITEETTQIHQIQQNGGSTDYVYRSNEEDQEQKLEIDKTLGNYESEIYNKRHVLQNDPDHEIDLNPQRSTDCTNCVNQDGDIEVKDQEVDMNKSLDSCEGEININYERVQSDDNSEMDYISQQSEDSNEYTSISNMVDIQNINKEMLMLFEPCESENYMNYNVFQDDSNLEETEQLIIKSKSKSEDEGSKTIKNAEIFEEIFHKLYVENIGEDIEKGMTYVINQGAQTNEDLFNKKSKSHKTEINTAIDITIQKTEVGRHSEQEETVMNTIEEFSETFDTKHEFDGTMEDTNGDDKYVRGYNKDDEYQKQSENCMFEKENRLERIECGVLENINLNKLQEHELHDIINQQDKQFNDNKILSNDTKVNCGTITSDLLDSNIRSGDQVLLIDIHDSVKIISNVLHAANVDEPDKPVCEIEKVAEEDDKQDKFENYLTEEIDHQGESENNFENKGSFSETLSNVLCTTTDNLANTAMFEAKKVNSSKHEKYELGEHSKKKIYQQNKSEENFGGELYEQDTNSNLSNIQCTGTLSSVEVITEDILNNSCTYLHDVQLAENLQRDIPGKNKCQLKETNEYSTEVRGLSDDITDTSSKHDMTESCRDLGEEKCQFNQETLDLASDDQSSSTGNANTNQNILLNSDIPLMDSIEKNVCEQSENLEITVNTGEVIIEDSNNDVNIKELHVVNICEESNTNFKSVNIDHHNQERIVETLYSGNDACIGKINEVDVFIETERDDTKDVHKNAEPSQVEISIVKDIALGENKIHEDSKCKSEAVKETPKELVVISENFVKGFEISEGIDKSFSKYEICETNFSQLEEIIQDTKSSEIELTLAKSPYNEYNDGYIPFPEPEVILTELNETLNSNLTNEQNVVDASGKVLENNFSEMTITKVTSELHDSNWPLDITQSKKQVAKSKCDVENVIDVVQDIDEDSKCPLDVLATYASIREPLKVKDEPMRRNIVEQQRRSRLKIPSKRMYVDKKLKLLKEPPKKRAMLPRAAKLHGHIDYCQKIRPTRSNTKLVKSGNTEDSYINTTKDVHAVPSEYKSCVNNQPAVKVYDEQQVKDNNVFSEDSCDSFKDNLIIAEDTKNKSEVESLDEETKRKKCIFDEETMDNGIVLHQSQCKDMLLNESTSIVISIPEVDNNTINLSILEHFEDSREVIEEGDTCVGHHLNVKDFHNENEVTEKNKKFPEEESDQCELNVLNNTLEDTLQVDVNTNDFFEKTTIHTSGEEYHQLVASEIIVESPVSKTQVFDVNYDSPPMLIASCEIDCLTSQESIGKDIPELEISLFKNGNQFNSGACVVEQSMKEISPTQLIDMQDKPKDVEENCVLSDEIATSENQTIPLMEKEEPIYSLCKTDLSKPLTHSSPALSDNVSRKLSVPTKAARKSYDKLKSNPYVRLIKISNLNTFRSNYIRSLKILSKILKSAKTRCGSFDNFSHLHSQDHELDSSRISTDSLTSPKTSTSNIVDDDNVQLSLVVEEELEENMNNKIIESWKTQKMVNPKKCTALVDTVDTNISSQSVKKSKELDDEDNLKNKVDIDMTQNNTNTQQIITKGSIQQTILENENKHCEFVMKVYKHVENTSPKLSMKYVELSDIKNGKEQITASDSNLLLMVSPKVNNESFTSIDKQLHVVNKSLNILEKEKHIRSVRVNEDICDPSTLKEDTNICVGAKERTSDVDMMNKQNRRYSVDEDVKRIEKINLGKDESGSFKIEKIHSKKTCIEKEADETFLKQEDSSSIKTPANSPVQQDIITAIEAKTFNKNIEKITSSDAVDVLPLESKGFEGFKRKGKSKSTKYRQVKVKSEPDGRLNIFQVSKKHEFVNESYRHNKGAKSEELVNVKDTVKLSDNTLLELHDKTEMALGNYTMNKDKLIDKNKRKRRKENIELCSGERKNVKESKRFETGSEKESLKCNKMELHQHIKETKQGINNEDALIISEPASTVQTKNKQEGATKKRRSSRHIKVWQSTTNPLLNLETKNIVNYTSKEESRAYVFEKMTISEGKLSRIKDKTNIDKKLEKTKENVIVGMAESITFEQGPRRTEDKSISSLKYSHKEFNKNTIEGNNITPKNEDLKNEAQICYRDNSKLHIRDKSEKKNKSAVKSKSIDKKKLEKHVTFIDMLIGETRSGPKDIVDNELSNMPKILSLDKHQICNDTKVEDKMELPNSFHINENEEKTSLTSDAVTSPEISKKSNDPQVDKINSEDKNEVQTDIHCLNTIKNQHKSPSKTKRRGPSHRSKYKEDEVKANKHRTRSSLKSIKPLATNVPELQVLSENVEDRKEIMQINKELDVNITGNLDIQKEIDKSPKQIEMFSGSYSLKDVTCGDQNFMNIPNITINSFTKSEELLPKKENVSKNGEMCSKDNVFSSKQEEMETDQTVIIETNCNDINNFKKQDVKGILISDYTKEDISIKQIVDDEKNKIDIPNENVLKETMTSPEKSLSSLQTFEKSEIFNNLTNIRVINDEDTATKMEDKENSLEYVHTHDYTEVSKKPEVKRISNANVKITTTVDAFFENISKVGNDVNTTNPNVDKINLKNVKVTDSIAMHDIIHEKISTSGVETVTTMPQHKEDVKPSLQCNDLISVSGHSLESNSNCVENENTEKYANTEVMKVNDEITSNSLGQKTETSCKILRQMDKIDVEIIEKYDKSDENTKIIQNVKSLEGENTMCINAESEHSEVALKSNEFFEHINPQNSDENITFIEQSTTDIKCTSNCEQININPNILSCNTADTVRNIPCTKGILKKSSSRKEPRTPKKKVTYNLREVKEHAIKNNSKKKWEVKTKCSPILGFVEVLNFDENINKVKCEHPRKVTIDIIPFDKFTSQSHNIFNGDETRESHNLLTSDLVNNSSFPTSKKKGKTQVQPLNLEICENSQVKEDFSKRASTERKSDGVGRRKKFKAKDKVNIKVDRIKLRRRKNHQQTVDVNNFSEDFNVVHQSSQEFTTIVDSKNKKKSIDSVIHNLKIKKCLEEKIGDVNTLPDVGCNQESEVEKRHLEPSQDVLDVEVQNKTPDGSQFEEVIDKSCENTDLLITFDTQPQSTEMIVKFCERASETINSLVEDEFGDESKIFSTKHLDNGNISEGEKLPNVLGVNGTKEKIFSEETFHESFDVKNSTTTQQENDTIDLKQYSYEHLVMDGFTESNTTATEVKISEENYQNSSNIYKTLTGKGESVMQQETIEVDEHYVIDEEKINDDDCKNINDRISVEEKSELKITHENVINENQMPGSLSNHEEQSFGDASILVVNSGGVYGMNQTCSVLNSPNSERQFYESSNFLIDGTKESPTTIVTVAFGVGEQINEASTSSIDNGNTSDLVSFTDENRSRTTLLNNVDVKVGSQSYTSSKLLLDDQKIQNAATETSNNVNDLSFQIISKMETFVSELNSNYEQRPMTKPLTDEVISSKDVLMDAIEIKQQDQSTNELLVQDSSVHAFNDVPDETKRTEKNEPLTSVSENFTTNTPIKSHADFEPLEGKKDVSLSLDTDVPIDPIKTNAIHSIDELLSDSYQLQTSDDISTILPSTNESNTCSIDAHAIFTSQNDFVSSNLIPLETGHSDSTEETSHNFMDNMSMKQKPPGTTEFLMTSNISLKEKQPSLDVDVTGTDQRDESVMHMDAGPSEMYCVGSDAPMSAVSTDSLITTSIMSNFDHGDMLCVSLCNNDLATSVGFVSNSPVPNEESSSSNKNFNSIDVDETPLVVRAKYFGSITQTGSDASDHSYSLGKLYYVQIYV